MNFNFEPMNFVNNLGYMGKGMIGIFVVIGVIVILTVVLNKVANNIGK
mgnify:FL=1